MGAQPPGGLEAIDVGHADVHENDFRSYLPRQPDGILAGGRLAHHLDVGRRVEQHPEPGTYQCLVIGEENPDHGVAPLVGSAARTRNPRPGSGAASNSPPAAVTRSRMPASP